MIYSAIILFPRSLVVFEITKEEMQLPLQSFWKELESFGTAKLLEVREYLKINVLGTIPYFVDGNVKSFGSRHERLVGFLVLKKLAKLAWIFKISLTLRRKRPVVLLPDDLFFLSQLVSQTSTDICVVFAGVWCPQPHL